MSKITTSLLQEMVQAAATRLGKQAEYVNSLNVFPVPDGDTGTNMGMTMDNGAKAVADQSASTVGEVGQILSKGLLMGARGTQVLSPHNCSVDLVKVSRIKRNLTAKI